MIKDTLLYRRTVDASTGGVKIVRPKEKRLMKQLQIKSPTPLERFSAAVTSAAGSTPAFLIALR